jgi:hypothetical protein
MCLAQHSFNLCFHRFRFVFVGSLSAESLKCTSPAFRTRLLLLTYICDPRPKGLAMGTEFLDRLATQLRFGKSAACHRAIQRILVCIREHYESGQYQSITDAEMSFEGWLKAT